jgi:DNA-binding response OmpR family regulator
MAKIMIVEDEPHIVESLTFLLTREGFEVEAIADGDADQADTAACAHIANARAAYVDIMLDHT